MNGSIPRPQASEAADGVVSELRARITEVDRELLRGVNRRLEIVRALHDHKHANAIPLRDPARESELLELLAADNGGPLSEEGLRAFFTHLIDLTRKELHGG